MSVCPILCLIPVEKTHLADRIRAAGATPVIDLTTASGPVPEGAWVRVVNTQGAPGTGPVIAESGDPLVGRACWRELTTPGAAPDGFEGIVLRGLGSGGRSGFADVRALHAALPPNTRAILDWPHPPEEGAPAADGLLLSDVLFGFYAPPALTGRLERISADDLLRIQGVAIVGSPTAPAARRLLKGEPLLAVARGYFSADDAFEHAWPGGAGLLHAAALRNSAGTLEAAIRAYASIVPEPARSAAVPEVTAVDHGPTEPIAVIGLGCRLPGAPNVPRLWEQLVAGFNAIVEVPHSRWDPALFWDPDHSAPDKTYTKIGGFITDFTFNPRRYRIPPSVARLIDPIQQMALEASADALDDAGYGATREYDRERVAVILGNSMGGEMRDEYTLRVMFPALRKALEEVPNFAQLPDGVRSRILSTYEESVKQGLPPITEDSMPGELSNVTAGRIANALNLGGPNFTTDAACAGSMAAMQAAVKGLQDRDFDLALTGGADRSMGVATYTKFCKIGALSPDGSRPFDANANGFVMGEGVGILVLKRLSDAERDGDKVYAVVRGIGGSSDGRGKGITAPNPEGQRRALVRAYENAGIDPSEVDMFECHGTSTVVGDKVEIDALTELIGRGRRGARGPVRIGSIKSNIGHLKSAAGAASALKACLALHHKVIPASINYQSPRKDIDLDAVPLRVPTSAEPWDSVGPRRVGISSFGFGGTNFHVVLEEYRAGMLVSRARSVTHISDSSAPVAEPAPAPAVAPAPVAVATPPVPVPAAVPAVARTFAPLPQNAVAVPEGIWAISADTPEEMVARARALKRGHTFPFEPDSALRLSAAAADSAERDQQLDKALAALQKGKGYDLLRQRSINLEDVPCDGQLAFLFTGQGSQYIGMGLDLAQQFPVVADTFREADEVMTPLLGRTLSSFIERNPALGEDEQFEALRATEISQPATLTVDVALLRLLSAYGVRPDMVAGHSLGEYGAAVAAGMLSFRDALIAVSARGREMAAVKIDDFGKMAGIATSVETVEQLLAEIPGYVVAANKNCPTQTVIAGETEAVEAAIEAFKSRGITVYPLPVSHAFHSRIVAPATEPLKRVLGALDLREPRRRITTNVDSKYYPTGPGAREKAIDILARQVASPVEWTSQIERMYADGARIFVECGPKRALAGFVVAILKHRPHRALYTNQPKRGGVYSFLDALAALVSLGFPVEPAPSREPRLFDDAGPRRSTSARLSARAEALRLRSEAAEAAPDLAATHGTSFIEQGILKIVSNKTGYPVDALDLDFELEADLGIDTVKLADIIGTVREQYRLEQDPEFRMGEHRTLRAVIDYAGRRIGSTRPAGVPGRRAAAAESGLEGGIGAEAAARFLAEVAQKDLRGLDASGFAQAMLPALQQFLQASWSAFESARGPVIQAALTAPLRPAPAVPTPPAAPALAPAAPVPAAPSFAAPANAPGPWDVRIVCSGASLGLPGGTEVFAADNIERMLAGENRIDVLPEEQIDRQLSKNLVRLVKNAQTGQGEFVEVQDRAGVIRLAGRRAHFDLAVDYGIDPGLVRSLDITTQLAFAAGLEALRDAGIPLVRTWRTTTTGKVVPVGWALPESMRDGTGIVFGSAFPGYDQLIDKLQHNGGDGEGHFDRRFLFQILAMGHSQFAQFIGARGPNTQLNAACASTTQGIAVAEDWIRLGRADRVIVLGADDVTNDTLFEWIGSGFLSAGAATTTGVVEDAALPFDRRRHGMILGMGAVGLVLERAEAVAARGMAAVAELLGTRITNSAFHGTRLDPEHIAREVRSFAEETVARAGVSREEFARRCVFLSHETYTPARGGSAAAEMASLPAAFGPTASRIVIANTKGFTGHPMGAGIEDTVAVKALQYQKAPPIANLKERDPDLGDLTLSDGGGLDVDYALRLAAGFGSQLALASWKKAARGDERVIDTAVYQAWLQASGAGELAVERRQLRWLPASVPEPKAPLSTPTPSAAELNDSNVSTHVSAPEAPKDVSTHVSPSGGVSTQAVTPAEVLDTLLRVVATKTGYDRSELDPTYELEADLGIDTVKQAEIFGEVRAAFDLERDDNFRLASYPTIEKLAIYLADQAAQRLATARPGTQAHGEISPPAPAAPPPRQAQEEHAEIQPPSATAPPRVSLAAAPLSVAPSAVGGVPVEEVLQALLVVVAAKTGYDVAELDPSYELEADLGIDTVKQAEIFGEVRARYGLGRDDSFRLADYPTLSGLATWLAGQTAQRVEPLASAPSDAGPIQAAPDPVVVRLVGPVVPVEAACSEAADPSEVLPASFRLRRPVYVERANSDMSAVKGRAIKVLGEGPISEAVRLALLAGGARLDGVVDAVLDVGTTVIEAFETAKSLAAKPPYQWISVVRPAGSWKEVRDAGARAGLAKALGREWPGCRARVVDLDLELELEPSEAADAILGELFETDRAVEVARGVGSRRVGALETERFPPRGTLPKGLVVLLTGGTRGITARVARAFAKAGPCVLILVGRTAAGAGPLDEDAARIQIKARIEADGIRATPKRIEDGLRPLRTAEEVRQNVEALEALGADVEVHAMDMSDDVEVEQLVELTLARHGRIDICVHGAGVEESRMLAEKDLVAFRRVYAGKAEGGLTLAAALPDTTFFFSMGSIAGRFGNSGQVDYSAANEAMARLCRIRPNSLHVCWTAWADVGMAVRGGMEALLTGRGVELLPADAGARLVYDLCAAKVTGEVMVAGKLGDFSLPSLHPLLDRVELDGDTAIGWRTLSLETDPWMADHAIDGLPVLPGVIGLELMAAAALAAMPRGTWSGFEAVRFAAPLKLHRDEPVEVEVRAEPVGPGELRCRLSSSRATRAGRLVRTDHFEATVRLDVAPAVPFLQLAAYLDDRLSKKDIYRRFFHGPRFQVLNEAEGVALQGLFANGSVEHSPIGEGFHTDPLVLEAAFQAAGLHRIATEGVMALPASIELVRRVRPVEEGELLNLVVHLHDGIYDIDVDGEQGPVMVVRGFRMVDKGPLPPGDRVPVPDGGWPSISVATAAEARVSLSSGEVAWATARGTPRRQADRLAGQLAARRAVERLVGHPDFTIVRAASGEPIVVGADARVSISHVEGEAVALALRGARAGVDLEGVEERHPGFANEWFSERERSVLAGAEALTAGWAVKEAVLKALGMGMALSPREVEVVSLAQTEARVHLSGAVARRHAELGGAPLRVRILARHGLVLATAVFAA